jgi:hypothetical protein
MRWMLTIATVSLLVLSGVASSCGDDDSTTTTMADNGAMTTTTTTTTTTTAPPGAGVDDPEREALHAVRGFMDARVDGSGAEGYLTDQAVENLGDDVVLYGVTSYEVGPLLGADANSYEVSVEVLDGDGDRTETLFVGPGEVKGELVPFAIRGVETD